MNPQTLTSPVLEDAALLLVQTKLEDGLSWLTTAYGRASRFVQRSGNIGEAYYPAGREIVSPVVYGESSTGEDYIRLFPDDTLGNFSYFDLTDEQRIDSYATKSPAKNIYKFGADLVVWFDFRTVYPSPADWKAYSVANVLQEVSDVLQESQIAGVSIEIERYYYSVENIYRGYDHKEIANQFAARPYGCFKIATTITYRKQC